MGFLDKTKDLGRKTVDLGKKGVDKGIDLGKKGVDATKEAVRKHTCVECKNYVPADASNGSCPPGGARMASADVGTCPQKAFAPKE